MAVALGGKCARANRPHYAGSEKRAAPTATPGVFWARFGPFCGALRDILRIYGFEGDARGQGEAFTRICESTFRREVLVDAIFEDRL